MAESANIARHLPSMAARQPNRAAIQIPRGRTRDGAIDYLTLSFAELDREVDAWVARLSDRGVQRGDRVLVMVRQGLPLIAAAFALFKLAAVPVIIDPGMGRRNFLECVARSQPRVLLGIPLAQITSRLARTAFATVKVRIWVSGSPVARLRSSQPSAVSGQLNSSAPPAAVSQPSTLNSQLNPDFQPSTFTFQPAHASPTDLAAILFTSGSTGSPKGVCYEHGMFEAQVRLIRATYGIEAGEVDLPMLPIFALFNPALGMTTIVPEIDPSRPADVDPEKIVRAIQQGKVTNSFGSPTLWRKIFDHCLTHRITLPSLRRVLCAGAAVPASLWVDAARVLPNGKLHSPYGATEVLPVATLSSDDVELRPEFGALIGYPLPENRVRIIEFQAGPIHSLNEAREMERGAIGEIIVTGPTVTKAYDHLPEATARAKIPAGEGAIWHRMGDAGQLDAQGRLWFCGRLVERVETGTGTLHTEPCEQVFRGHPKVIRCALIGLGERGQQEPALVVQPPGNFSDQSALARELRQLAAAQPHTAAIRKYFFHPDFPVDVRHNAKIHRLSLAKWAVTAKAFEPELVS